MKFHLKFFSITIFITYSYQMTYQCTYNVKSGKIKRKKHNVRNYFIEDFRFNGFMNCVKS